MASLGNGKETRRDLQERLESYNRLDPANELTFVVLVGVAAMMRLLDRKALK